MTTDDIPANPMQKNGYHLVFHDEFDGNELDTQKWLPFYLPHWSSRERSKPTYLLSNGYLTLRISMDQKSWCPEFDGDVKCSSIQTGEFSGPVGSQHGQHRFHQACTVREAQENVQLFTPKYGFFEMRAKAVWSNRNHVALWMIGYEDMPERSGEIAVFEIMGAFISESSSRIGYGVRKWGDPMLVDAFSEEFFPIDANHFHIYALEWFPTHLDFFIDNRKTKTIEQSPDYPMQFMLSIYELPGENHANETYPKDFVIDYFRAYRPFNEYGVERASSSGEK